MASRSGRRGFALAPVLVAAGLLAGCGGEAPPRQLEAASPPSPAPATDFDHQAARRLGEGFLVWESDRSGPWRLWTRRLDGSGLRQLTADEPGRQHCCGHISPSGDWVTYLSLTGGRDEYVDGVATGELRLLRIDGTDQRVLVPRARIHHENRAAVWANDEELIYLTADGRTALVNIETRARRIVVDEPMEEYGWLLNSDLTYASLGWPSFSVYDDGVIAARAPVGGCQPYFSHDGRWGFWTAGAGGPIRRIELATGEVTTLLRKNDPLLPPGRGYLYFPMVSRDGRLLAVGASQGRHDHFRADYEIFVFETDPRTLEVLGDPVRFTFHGRVDRFPDLWSEPLALGDHAGEAPFEVELAVPEALADRGPWRWESESGWSAQGRRVTRGFETPGIYRLTAEAAGESLVGMVRVAPAAAPRVVRHELRRSGQEVEVWFDERVDLARASARFESGLAVESMSPGRGMRSLILTLAESVAGAETLMISGVADRAQRPNLAGELSVVIEPPMWPLSEEDLLFLWQTADAANLVRHPVSGAERAPQIRAEGRAALDHDFALALAGGSFVADGGSGETTIMGLEMTHELTIEATLTAANPGGEGRILFLGGSSRREVELSQRDGALWFALRARRNRSKTWSPEARLFDIEPGLSVHLTVTYQPGQLRAYRDGLLVTETDTIQGDFFRWEHGNLVLGAGWRGSIEGLAFYARVLAAAEVSENAARYASLRSERASVERVEIEATRTRSSTRPRLSEISPYREALVVNEYRVERVLSGEFEGELVRVAEWAILGGESQPATPGRVRLVLERFADNPQLEGTVLRNELDESASAAAGALYYAVP